MVFASETGFQTNYQVNSYYREVMQPMQSVRLNSETGSNNGFYPGRICAPVSAPAPLESVFPADTGLDFLWIEVTPRCNLACVHCYGACGSQEPLGARMSFDDWKRILTEAFELGCRQIQFTGGEPTMVPYLDALLAEARGIGYHLVEVFTNGTLVSDRIMSIFQHLQVSLAFSIYSSQAEIHDAITRQRGSLSQTLGAIRRAIKSGLPTRAAVIAMKYNLNNIEQTVSFLREMGVISIIVDQVRPVGRGVSLSGEKSPFQIICKDCSQSKLCIQADGRIFPCIFARTYPTGHAVQGLQRILETKVLGNFHKMMQ